ncbi:MULTISPECIES: hypothetical protein [unclassified Phormidium]|uniref:hypothetical protein n=1 Tax=Cyanophyceae TaxID=3028117 RepID=UPI00168640EC|nr:MULTISPECIES: hypothetical protein [unclassified Phormidium]MBD1914630.1 hypothetical protein [Phormidium sp. FACHB-77]
MASSAESAQDFQDSQSSPENHFYSTFIVEYVVPEKPEAEAVFQQWYDWLAETASSLRVTPAPIYARC